MDEVKQNEETDISEPAAEDHTKTEREVTNSDCRIIEEEDESTSSGREKADQEKNQDVDAETNEDESTGEISSEYEDYSSGDDLGNEATVVGNGCIPVWNKSRKEEPELPPTTTILTTPQGAKVYLVGTVHFSQESQEDVAKTIQETQPDIVVVELCKSRVNILSMDEQRILEESKDININKIRLAIKQNGVVQGVMYLLLLSMSAHLTKQLGMAPGGEFRRAFTESRKVPGCLLHLGDRPIGVTLQRALGALTLWQKLKLAWSIISSKEPITKAEVERFKRSDLLEELLAEMTGEFPALSKVFVTERDHYLAYSLQLAASPIRTNQGVVPAVVVGVVGIGHVPGIVENWGKVSEKQIKEIIRIPAPSRTSKVLRITLRVAIIGGTIWGASRLLLPNHIYSSIYAPRQHLNTLFNAVLNR